MHSAFQVWAAGRCVCSVINFVFCKSTEKSVTQQRVLQQLVQCWSYVKVLQANFVQTIPEIRLL